MIEERLALLRRTQCSELAKWLGKSHATVSRDRAAFGQWRADELLTIAGQDAELRHALLAALQPPATPANDADTFRSVVEELGQMAALSKTISMAIADQRIDAQEARNILQDVYRMVAFIERSLIPSLERMRDQR